MCSMDHTMETQRPTLYKTQNAHSYSLAHALAQYTHKPLYGPLFIRLTPTKLKPIILANRSLKLFECPIMIVCGDFLIQRERVSDLLRARAGCTYLGPGTRREQRKTCPYKTQNIHRVKIISFCIGMFEFFGWHGMAWFGCNEFECMKVDMDLISVCSIL